MVIEVTKPYVFELQELLATFDETSGLRWSAVELAKIFVSPGSNPSTVPDWVFNEELFTFGVADGSISVVTPTSTSRLISSVSPSTVALPTLGESTTVLVENPGQIGVYVLLGTTSPVNVTPENGQLIPAKSSATLTVDSNTYIGAVNAGDGYFNLPISITAGS